MSSEQGELAGEGNVAADPGRAFAQLMSAAADVVTPDGGEAPYGWTTDPDGTRRPKKTAGRPRKSPPLEELKAQRAAAAAEDSGPAGSPEPERPPSGKRRRSKTAAAGPDKPEAPVPQFREGQIAKGVNRLYRRAGRIVRAFDPEIGAALIEITRKDILDDGAPDPEDVTVGEAWEEIARTNPRIRRWLLKIIAGGAWGQLVMVHAPVLLAVLMKDAVRKRLPLSKLLAAFFSDDDDQGDAVGSPDAGSPGNGPGPLVGGLSPEDLQQLAGIADQMMGQMTGKRRPGGTPRARPAAGPRGAASRPAA